MYRPRPMYFLTLMFAAALWNQSGHAQLADADQAAAVQGRIIVYGAQKAAWPNHSIVCTLPANSLWAYSLHDRRARGIHGRRCRPDRARHISVVGPVAAGTRLQFFNNRNASTTRPGDSSFAQITFRQALSPRQYVIIGSFEGFQSNPLFHVASYCNRTDNGRRACPARGGDYLDGKVSYIRVLPPSAAEYDSLSIDGSDDAENMPDVNAVGEDDPSDPADSDDPADGS